jgi:transketolase N-terminal domain/subunit
MDERLERFVIEAMSVQGKMARAFYAALVEQGFTEAEAMALTSTWVTAQTMRPATRQR